MSFNHNGIDWPDSTHTAKTNALWNRPKNEYITKSDGTREYGMNRVGFEKYPQMLYMAQMHPLNNRYEVSIHQDIISMDKTQVLLDAQQFNSTCQRVVKDENEFNRAISEGWRVSPSEAMAYREGLANDVAVAAAYRAAQDRKMSQKAQDEAAEADKATPEHLAEIPVKRRGRPRKVQAEA